MNTQAQNIDAILSEYATLISEATVGSEVDKDRLKILLVETAEWTPAAAEQLIQLAHDYGTFMLRNALALSIALDIEDGELGF